MFSKGGRKKRLPEKRYSPSTAMKRYLHIILALVLGVMALGSLEGCKQAKLRDAD